MKDARRQTDSMTHEDCSLQRFQNSRTTGISRTVWCNQRLQTYIKGGLSRVRYAPNNRFYGAIIFSCCRCRYINLCISGKGKKAVDFSSISEMLSFATMEHMAAIYIYIRSSASMFLQAGTGKPKLS